MPRHWVPIILVLWLLSALAPAQQSAKRIPPDYRAFLDAQDFQNAGRLDDALRSLAPVWKTTPVSPLNGKAALLAAQVYMAAEKPQDAIVILRQHYQMLPQPEGDVLLGRAAETLGDHATAAAWWQGVYYGFPLSKEYSVEAEAALDRLKVALGAAFPPMLPLATLNRAERLSKAGQSAKARQELLAAVPWFAGLEREQALVRANSGDAAALAALDLKEPEADAERIYLRHTIARRQSREAEAEATVNKLVEKYPKSPWTMEALIAWGNYFTPKNEVARYVPIFRRCAENFPGEAQAAYCHWKVAWASWMAREPGAKQMMADHVARWPSSEKASAALYFLGRYDECMAKWPMSYYSVLSRQKLAKGAAPPKPAPPAPAVFQPTPAVQARIARARQLAAADLPEWAEFELKFAATEQPFVAAMELAEVAAARQAHDQALRYIKSTAKGYLNLPLESAPERFWKAAFPLPYQKTIVTTAKTEGLEPHLLAALIRQESEFNPKAVSRSKAYGLTQVMPATGRELYRQLKLGTFRTSVLHDPDINVKLGAHYLKRLNSSLDGRWEHTLASYNAGKSRVVRWQGWFDYREPAEFIECIPFNETREYVQIVLRNADVYRRLYGPALPAAPPPSRR